MNLMVIDWLRFRDLYFKNSVFNEFGNFVSEIDLFEILSSSILFYRLAWIITILRVLSFEREKKTRVQIVWEIVILVAE